MHTYRSIHYLTQLLKTHFKILSYRVDYDCKYRKIKRCKDKYSGFESVTIIHELQVSHYIILVRGR